MGTTDKCEGWGTTFDVSHRVLLKGLDPCILACRNAARSKRHVDVDHIVHCWWVSQNSARLRTSSIPARTVLQSSSGVAASPGVGAGVSSPAGGAGACFSRATSVAPFGVCATASRRPKPTISIRSGNVQSSRFTITSFQAAIVPHGHNEHDRSCGADVESASPVEAPMRPITLLILPPALACGDTKTEQGIAGSAGDDGTSGEDGDGGEDGAPGADGTDGEAGGAGGDR